MKGMISLIAATHAAVAFGSLLAVRAVSRTMDDMRRGGGISALVEGIMDAARWPLLAAWVAVAVSLVVLVAVMRRAELQKSSARTVAATVIAIGAGVAAVFVFRAFTTSLIDATVPPGTGWRVMYERLTSASAITALCFAAATAVALMAFRTRAAKRLAVVAAVVSLGVSATMIVTLRDLRARYESMSAGDLGPVEELINRPIRESPR